MLSSKVHRALLVAVAVQIVLVLVMWSRGGSDSSAAKPHPLLPDFDAAKVTRVEIEAGSGASVELAKQGSGWVVASAWDTPVRAGAMDGLLSSLAKMSAAAPIATSAGRHEQLELTAASPTRKVTIESDGKTATLLVGKALGGGRTAVRFGNDDDVYAVAGVSATSVGADAKSWMDTQVLSVAPNGIRKLAIQAKSGTLTLVREAESAPWQMAWNGTISAEPVDMDAVSTLIETLAMVQATDAADPKRDVSAPAAVIELSGEPGTMILDVVDDGASYYLRQRGSAHAVLVAKASLAPVLAASVDSLIKRPNPSPGPSSPGLPDLPQ